MQYQFAPNSSDSDMIEATYTWVHKGKPRTILAFVVHIDCIEDSDIVTSIKEHGSATVDMSLGS